MLKHDLRVEYALPDSYAWCLDRTRRSRSNFYYSFFTLPRALFRDMCVLYAFMRVSDDLGDDEGIPLAERGELLERWREQVSAALDDGRCDHPVLPALVDIVRRHRIPPEYLFAVIDGVRMDLDFRGFETFEELSEYCYHVAGAVGLCCIHIWGFTGPAAIPLAIDCGLAFQMTNILRDLAEDARLGRCYLPREDLRRFDLAAGDLRSGAGDPRIDNLLAWEVGRTREYFARSAGLLAYTPKAGKPIFAAMFRTYGSLLDAIERRRSDGRSGRVELGRFRKMWIVFGSLVRYRWLPFG